MKKLLLGTVLSTALLLAACGSEEPEKETMKAEETEETDTSTATEESTETEEVETSNGVKPVENNTYEIEMAKVEVTNTKILPPNEYSDTGKDRLVVTYEVTSKVTPEEAGEVDVSPMMVWIATVEPTQETPDTIQRLSGGGIPLEDEYNKYLDSQSAIIKKDKTVENVTMYELENRDNPVILNVTQGVAGEDLGSIEIDVSE